MVSRASVAAFLATLVLASILPAACAGNDEEVAPASPTSSPVATAAPTAGPTNTPAATPNVSNDWLTYTDQAFGYSFDYPPSWFLIPEGKGGSVTLYSYDPAGVVGDGRPVPVDKLKIFIWVAEGVDKPLEQWLADGRAQANAEQNLPIPTVISQSPVILAGKQGLVEIVESDGTKSISYYIDLGKGRVFVVNAGPADSQVLPEFDTLLTTVQFAT